MKNYLFFALLILLSYCTTAQTTTSIYFASGSSQLDPAATANLQKLVGELQQLKDFELDIQAYTDDIGSEATNRQLASRRSQAVKDFLLKQNISPSRETVKNIGEIRLSGENTEEQRRQNRRVEIRFTAFQPQNMSELFSYFQQNDQQQFSIASQSASQIKGEKGVILNIPANCFQRKDGSAVEGEVKISLREMHSYGDMLRANLTTVSNGKMLETGGMIHLTATDALGNELELKQGTEIQAVMPTEMENMGLFLADRNATDPHAEINWQASGVPASTTSLVRGFRREIDYTLSAPDLETWSHNDEIYYSPDSLVLFPEGNLPTAQLNLSKKPVFVANPKYKEPTLATVTENTPRKRGEKKTDYATRMQSTYERRLSTYRNTLSTEKERYAQFQRDSIAYTQIITQKEAYFNCYITFNKHWENTINLINRKVVYGVGAEIESVCAFYNRVQKPLDELKAEATKWGISTEEIDKIKASTELETKINELNAMTKAQTDFAKRMDELTKIANSYEGNSLRNSVSYAYGNNKKEKTAWDWNNSEHLKQLQKAVSLTKEIFANDTFQVLLKTYYGLAAETQKLYSLCKNVNEIIKSTKERILETKKERGLLTDQESMQIAGTALGITRMGWINCDRFYKNTSPQTNIEIYTQAAPGTEHYFVVFKNIRSVMPANAGPNGMQVSSIPANEEVKIVGLRVVNGEVQVFVREGVVGDFPVISPIFETKKIDDLQALLSEV